MRGGFQRDEAGLASHRLPPVNARRLPLGRLGNRPKMGGDLFPAVAPCASSRDGGDPLSAAVLVEIQRAAAAVSKRGAPPPFPPRLSLDDRESTLQLLWSSDHPRLRGRDHHGMDAGSDRPPLLPFFSGAIDPATNDRMPPLVCWRSFCGRPPSARRGSRFVERRSLHLSRCPLLGFIYTFGAIVSQESLVSRSDDGDLLHRH